MANDDPRPKEPAFNIIRVGNLPFGVSAREITSLFEPFGTVKKLHLKRRVAKDSEELLRNPFVILIFEQAESVDEIMASRPFYLGDSLLFIRRFMQITPEYPDDAWLTVRKILVHTPSEENDKTIVEYLSSITNGNIVFFERLDDRTFLVQFDDYDPVDLCCLLRPHFINNQPVEIKKCRDEKQVRQRIEFERKYPQKIILSFRNFYLYLFRLNPLPTEPFYQPIPTDLSGTIMNTTSPTPILSIDDQMTQIRSSHNETLSRVEREHEQLVTSLSEEWKETARERIRFERLTSDLKNEAKRLREEHRKWQKLFSESLKEKPLVQSEGERQLNEASQAYEQLLQKKSSMIN